jgi:hypothetical protein
LGDHLVSRRMASCRIHPGQYLRCCHSSAAPRRCARQRLRDGGLSSS